MQDSYRRIKWTNKKNYDGIVSIITPGYLLSKFAFIFLANDLPNGNFSPVCKMTSRNEIDRI